MWVASLLPLGQSLTGQSCTASYFPAVVASAWFCPAAPSTSFPSPYLLLFADEGSPCSCNFLQLFRLLVVVGTNVVELGCLLVLLVEELGCLLVRLVLQPLLLHVVLEEIHVSCETWSVAFALLDPRCGEACVVSIICISGRFVKEFFCLLRCFIWTFFEKH